MKLYIITPVINCLELTKAYFESIKTKEPFHFILIDNESNDGTKQWGEEMQGDDFTYIYNSPKKGVAASWNQGIEIALKDPECTYIAIPNNDIVLHEKTLDHLMAFMDKTGYLMVTADNIADRMSIDTMQKLELPKKFTDYDCQTIEGWRAEGPDFSRYMISPETIRVIGKFDENFEGAYCEDEDMHRRINAARNHAEIHNDQAVTPEKIHAKRLSTAPYYHYASQTVKRVIEMRHDIATSHGKNQNYYLEKWGANHPNAMDGEGYLTPFGRADMNWRDW